MGADFRMKKNGKKNKFKFNPNKNSKEKFCSPNDIPLGPRRSWTGESQESKSTSDKASNLEGGQKKTGKRHSQSEERKDKRNHDQGKKFNKKKGWKDEVEFNPKSKKSIEERKEVERLTNLLENDAPMQAAQIKTFKDLPLSKKTQLGLRDSEYEVPTEIQKESLGLALKGLDILGAAKTGSGKTLAFLIPVIEKLYRSQWSNLDGLGAVIITPTRELAYQIFETLRKIGRYHDFSAGLVIGGKDIKFERKRVDQLNIIICTPGRLLQHMDESYTFNTSNLQILVLDEADRCLDMGFEKDMNAILEHLPTERQTLLFSATQTKSVKDLARLSMKSPVYVSVHENSQFSTPETLQQSYVICPLELKLDMLWSFLKHHKKSKILVFMASCKQVRFANMLFCRMRPGVSILALHGSMHQLKRMAVYDEFCKKQAVVLFATDIAARGLDFPSVDWVLQLDCPEDATTYIHRAGRTARFNKGGEALLVLLPSEEEGMLAQLEQKRIPIEKIEINMKKMMSVTRKFEALLARDLTLKECAQRAFKSYLKSVFLMKNKDIFDVSVLELPSFAGSLGLAVAPRVRFLQNRGKDKRQNPANESDTKEESESVEDNAKSERIIQPKKKGATFDFSTVDDDEDIDTLFTGKKPVEVDSEGEAEFALNLEENESNEKSKKIKTKAAVAKKLMKKKIQINKKVVFDEEGETVPDTRRDKRSEFARQYEMKDAPGIDVKEAIAALKEEDQFDKQLFRERVKAKHREARRKAKLARKGLTEEDEEDGAGPTIGSGQDSDDDAGPNLDWLPDPDKIYGKVKDKPDSEGDSDEFNDSEGDDDDEWSLRGNKRQREVVNTDSESDSDEEPPPKKKFTPKTSKNNAKNKVKHKAKLHKSKDLQTDLMEDLALQLLRSKR